MPSPYQLFGQLSSDPVDLRLSICANDWCKISYLGEDGLSGIDRFTNVADTLRLFLEDPNDPLFGADNSGDTAWRQVLSNRNAHSEAGIDLDGRSDANGFEFRIKDALENTVKATFRVSKENAASWVSKIEDLQKDFAALIWRHRFSLLFLPGTGKWADLTLRLEDEGCNVGVSTSDHDVLAEICQSVLKVAEEGGTAKTNWWSLEPYIVQFAIRSTDKETANIVLTWFDDLVDLNAPIERDLEETIFVCSIPLAVLARELVDQCQLIAGEFGEEAYSKRIGHAFPAALLQRLQAIA